MMEFVQDFHRKFGFKTLDQPGWLDPERTQARLNFILEELLETASACGASLQAQVVRDEKGMPVGMSCPSFKMEPMTKMMAKRNLADALDGLIDLTYVVFGMADLMGFNNRTPGNDLLTELPWTVWQEAYCRVQQANLAKVRVDSAEESKRGTIFDVKKPEGWKAPDFTDLLPMEE